MIIRDGSDDRNQRRFTDIGRITASAESHLQNDIVSPFFVKIQDRDGSDDLEFRRGLLACVHHALHLLQHAIGIFGQIRIADIGAVQFDPLVEDLKER